MEAFYIHLSFNEIKLSEVVPYLDFKICSDFQFEDQLQRGFRVSSMVNTNLLVQIRFIYFFGY
jgi:hypothetical protein